MLLSSSAYFIFLAFIFLLYWPGARYRALGLALVLFGNYFFYAKWDLFYLLLIPLASSVDFAIGFGLQSSERKGVRRLLVSLSILMNLGLLTAFKYMPFLLENWSRVSGRPVGAWNWTFPLGISFYTFQALTYTIDLYRRDIKGTRSYLAYMTSVSFFPTTLAGPITRVGELLKQFEKPNRWLDAADGGRALFLIGLGLMKKLLIADYLAENLVNRVFDFPALYTGAEVLIGVYSFALQLYYDFSGYTDIAMGSALLLGIKLPRNFNMPYSAVNINDFWRRWHITLSNWLRDYLYFSLPGVRGKVMPYLNLIITMVLGGLWHGASWNFVIWGLLHGVGQAFTRGVQSIRGNRPARTPAWLRIFFTVQFVCFAWIYFRAATLEQSGEIIARIASLTWSLDNISASLWVVFAVAVAGHYLPPDWLDRTRDTFSRTPFYVQAAAMLLLVIAIQYVAATGAAPFIYTKF